jgi:hypothetical protein
LLKSWRLSVTADLGVGPLKKKCRDVSRVNYFVRFGDNYDGRLSI